MQILLNTDKNTDGSAAMAQHLEQVVGDAMSRFADHVTRVEAHLADANSVAKSTPDEIHCTLEAHLVHHDPIVVKDHANTAHQAISGATGKLKRALATVIDKKDPRRAAAEAFSAPD